jgi:ATP-binding cassette subfamily F protein 3
MLTKPLNLLILDEPTNHLDIWTKDILLDALSAFTGTIIFVCHDRAFMERLSTKTLYLDEGKHTLYYGGYAWFMEKTKEMEAESQAAAPENGDAQRPSPGQSAGREHREETKKLKADEKRRKKREEDLIERIDTLEADRKRAEEELSRPEVYSSGEKAKKIHAEIQALEAALEAANAEWESLG